MIYQIKQFSKYPQFYRQNEPFIEMGWSIGPCEVASKPPFSPKFCLRLPGYHLLEIYTLNLPILMLTCVRQQENWFWLRDLSLLMAVLTLARLNLFSSCTTAAAHWSTVNIPVSAGPVSLFRYIVYSVQKVWVLALCIVFERVCVCVRGRPAVDYKSSCYASPKLAERLATHKPPPQKRENNLSPSLCRFLFLYLSLFAPPVWGEQ